MIQWLRALAAVAVSPYARLDRADWLGLVGPFFCWSLVAAAMAPFIQLHTLPLLSTTAPSIYDTVYPAGLARFPTLEGWLTQAFQWQSLPVALVATLSAFACRSIRSQAIAGGLGFASAYVASDTWIYLTVDGSALSPFSVVGANALGGLAFAAAIALAMATIARVIVAARALRGWRALLGAIVLAGFAFMTVAGADLFIRLFYRPLEVNIDLLAGQSASGAYGQTSSWVAARSDMDIVKVRENEFSLLPLSTSAKSISITSPGMVGALNWRRREGAATYRLDIYAFSGCIPGKSLDVLGGNPSLTYPSVSTLSVAAGVDDMRVRSDGRFTVNERNGEVSQFWLKPAKKEDRFEVRTFTSNEGGFLLQDRATLSIEVAQNLFTSTDASRTLKAASRTIRFAVNGDRRELRLRPSASTQESELLHCQPIRDLRWPAAEVAEYGPEFPIVSLVFKLTRNEAVDGAFTTIESEAVVQGADGWATIAEVERRAVGLGELGLLDLSQDLRALEVDRRLVSVQPSDRLFIVGDLRGSYTDRGELRVTGPARAIWKNGIRLNRTLWENLTDTWQLALVGAFGGAMVFLFQFVRITLRNRWEEDPADWL